MPTRHDVISAVPVTGNVDKALLRALMTRRMAYCLAASELASDFIAADVDTGILPTYLIQKATLYQLDALDTTTPAGATCLVTSDGKRYKSDQIGIPVSVLDKDLTAQPASPSVGDRYLIPAGATGASWSGQDGKIGEYTPSGWSFSTIDIGRLVYVKDESAFYHRNASGAWTSGVGTIVISASTIPPSALIWDGRVQNQTTNTPPSAAQGIAFIIGSSPTGAWSGNAGKLAIRETSGTSTTYTIYTPKVGQTVFDIALGYLVQWDGTAWAYASGAIVGQGFVYTSVPTSGTTSGSGFYGGYKNNLVPGGEAKRSDNVTLSYTAKRAGAPLRLTYQANVSFSAPAGPIRVAIALYLDNNTTSIAYQSIYVPGTGDMPVHVVFRVPAIDALAHTYRVAILGWDGANGADTFDHRTFEIMEAA